MQYAPWGRRYIETLHGIQITNNNIIWWTINELTWNVVFLNICPPIFRRVRTAAKSVCWVLPSLSARIPLDRFTRNMTLGTCMKICLETPPFVQIRQKYGTLHMQNYRRPTVAGDMYWPQEQFCATLLTVTISLTLHTERIVVFPVQQWLRRSVSYLRHTKSNRVAWLTLRLKELWKSTFYTGHNNVLQWTQCDCCPKIIH